MCKTCGFGKLRKTKILFHAQLSQKIFLVLRIKNSAKLRKTHCVWCAKIAQKFAKKIYAKIARFLRKRFSHFVETLLLARHSEWSKEFLTGNPCIQLPINNKTIIKIDIRHVKLVKWNLMWHLATSMPVRTLQTQKWSPCPHFPVDWYIACYFCSEFVPTWIKYIYFYYSLVA